MDTFEGVEIEFRNKADASALMARFDQIDSRFDRLDGRMDKLYGRMDSLDGKISAVDGKVGDLDHRFDALDRTVNSNHKETRDQFDEVQRVIGESFVKHNEEVDQRQDRHENWIHQLANATGTQLTPEL